MDQKMGIEKHLHCENWCGRRGHDDVEEKLKHVCKTDRQDSMYSFTDANTGFGGATACYHPLQPSLVLD